jgi:hypothetical protein
VDYWTKQKFLRGSPNVQKKKKYMKECSPSLEIKEMQIKTTLRFHFTPVKIAIIKSTTANKCWQGCRKKEPSYTAFGNVSYYNHFGKQYVSFFKKLIHLPYDPAIPLLGVFLKECNSDYYKGTCTLMFTEALFTIVKL